MRKFGKIALAVIVLSAIALVIIGAITRASDIRENCATGSSITETIDKNCSTKYPIVIAHHWGPPRYRTKDAAGKTMEYFYRPVIEVLRRNGADVRVAEYSHDYDTTPSRARELKKFIHANFINNREYMREWTGRYPGMQFKVNLIGHSQGCQDSRYMIANEGMAEMTASWTGLAGESRGTPMADLGIAFYDCPLFNIFADSLLMRLFPDSCPDSEHVRLFIESVRCLTEDYMQNKGDYGPGGRFEGRGYSAPYAQGVYYQNWAARLRWMPREWSALYPLWKYIRLARGDNDIYTPVSSQIHENGFVANRGVLDGDARCAGVHHMAFTGSQNQENPGFNAEQFWIDLVAGLRAKGL